MNREDTDELPFSDDFAQRVLDVAGGISLRRRRMLRASVGAAVVLLAGAGALRFVPVPVTQSTPRLVAGFDTATADDTQTELTNYMFPEAADLAQFSDDYAGAADDDQALFAEDEEGDGSSD
jgi:hypothetical protein